MKYLDKEEIALTLRFNSTRITEAVKRVQSYTPRDVLPLIENTLDRTEKETISHFLFYMLNTGKTFSDGYFNRVEEYVKTLN